MIKGIPKSLLWNFESRYLKDKSYLKHLDFIKKHTAVDYVAVAPRKGVQLQNLDQCHGVIKELTEYAHKIGLKICLHLVSYPGFYNVSFLTDNHPAIDQVQMFPIADPKAAQAIACDVELTLDENGRAAHTHHAIWGRSKIMPIYSRIIKAYSFEKSGEGFYRPDTLRDVSREIRITNSRTNMTEFEIDLGKDMSGKTVFVLVAQYYNYPSVSEDFENYKTLIDAYSDIPLDGIQLDEYGYMMLNSSAINKGEEPPFRGRMYSAGDKKYYEDVLGIDLELLLFNMRYAPENNEKIRIEAINTYFEVLRHFPLEMETKVYNYSKKIFGEDIYFSCHNTFHNRLDGDEVWRSACNWWDIPRDLGHTDENICFPVRWGIMLACKNPITIDMYYAKQSEKHYAHMIEAAPYNCREFHHAYGDFSWGSSFTEPDFLENIKKLDTHIAALDDFQRVYPKMDLLIIFGASAQFNWYPNHEARNLWDIDGTLKIQEKSTEIWNEGYRCALVPDYAITDGRITLNADKIIFNGYEFSHCLFFYPKYAKKTVYDFLNRAAEYGTKIAVVGDAGIDFSGNSVSLTAPHYDEFDMSILVDIGCEKSAIDGGCVYADGSFSLVSDSLLTGSETDFSFKIGEDLYRGKHTGILAYRSENDNMATSGSILEINGKRVKLKEIKV